MNPTPPPPPPPTRRPSRRLVKIVSLIAIPAAVAVSGLVVSQASYSAYSATTVNPTSNWTTGTVALTDDDANTAAFTAANLKPGSTGTKCIAVTSTGTLASAVKLYGTDPGHHQEPGLLHHPDRHPGHRRLVRLLHRLHPAGHRRQPLHRHAGRASAPPPPTTPTASAPGPPPAPPTRPAPTSQLHRQRRRPRHHPGRHRRPRPHLGGPEQLTATGPPGPTGHHTAAGASTQQRRCPCICSPTISHRQARQCVGVDRRERAHPWTAT